MIAPNDGLRVNRDALERYCKELPGARTFLENFFLSAQGHPMDQAILNYMMDLRLYSPTNRTIRQNQHKMLQAFSGITGTIISIEVDSVYYP
jgi:hypothetical protein